MRRHSVPWILLFLVLSTAILFGAAPFLTGDQVLNRVFNSTANTLKVEGALSGGTIGVTDGGGSLTVDATSWPLPTGAGTAALQTSGNASLTSIDGKMTACNTGAVTISSSALPTGASTEATLATLGTEATLAALSAKITACDTTGLASLATEATLSALSGKITACNTGDVTISASALPTGAATEATLSAMAATITACDTTGLATEATLAALSGNITACNTGDVTISASALPTGAATEATLAALAALFPASIGQKTSAGSLSVVLSSDHGDVPITATTLPLPTGASTEATLAALDAKVTACNTGSVTVASSALPTGAATEASLTSLDGKVTACNTGAIAGAVTAVGTVAENGASPGAPVMIGGEFQAGDLAIVAGTAGDVTRLKTNSQAIPYVLTWHPYTLQGNHALAAGTATNQDIIAAVANRYIYITDVYISTAAATTFTIEDDDATLILSASLAANGGISHHFAQPWRVVTVGKGVQYDTAGATTSCVVITGFALPY